MTLADWISIEASVFSTVAGFAIERWLSKRKGKPRG